jgi:ABC-type uncharacterized transport system substrate-binding protein
MMILAGPARAMVAKFALIATLFLLAVPFHALAQRGKSPRIGCLAGSRAGGSSHLVAALRDGLRERGWTPGQNITAEYRFAEGQIERLPDLAAELVRLNVEVIVAVSTPAARAAKHATSTIPIVMVGVGDPVALGYVASLARPGGNITGVSSVSVALGPKRLELLRETVAGLRRVHILWNPGDPARALEVRDIQIAAERLGLAVRSWEVRTLADVEHAFATMGKAPTDGLIVQQDPFNIANRVRIAELALVNRVPSISPFREFAEAGGLLTYGASVADMVRRSTYFVDKILKGHRPADLPVEEPTTFELVINRKTAKALGVTIPPSLLLQAGQVIE